MSNVVELVVSLAQPILQERGLELWDAEFKKEGADYYLRLYINRKDGEIGIEDCEAVTRFVDPLLDEADPIDQSYYFEVSSAGLVRTLTYDWHYDRYLGKTVTVHTYKAVEGLAKKFDAVLDGYDAESVSFTVNGKSVRVEKKQISKIIIDLI